MAYLQQMFWKPKTSEKLLQIVKIFIMFIQYVCMDSKKNMIQIQSIRKWIHIYIFSKHKFFGFV